MTIDFHSHYISLEAAVHGAQQVGLRLEYERVDGDTLTLAADGHRYTSLPAAIGDIDRQLADLEDAHLDGRTLMPPPFLMLYHLPPEKGAVWARAINEGTMAAVTTDSERLIGFATVPLQAPERAVAELEYAVEELGMQGVEIATHAPNFELDDEALLPFFEKVAAYDLPLLVHPHDVAGLDRMGHHELRNLVGNPMETTLAGARLIFGGVLERVDGLKVILSHGGGALPYLVGRLNHGWQARLGSKPTVPDGEVFDSHLRRLYFDSVVFDARVLRYMADIVSAERIVLGTDYPFDMSDSNPIGRLREALSESDVETVLLTAERFANTTVLASH